jgi:hypothetical protein
MSHWETIWSFRTANFRVTFDVAPEDCDPADSFEFDEDIEAVRNGEVEWFQARVAVHFGESIVGADYLGACAYKTFAEFRESHFRSPAEHRNTLANKAAGVNFCDYFPSMIRAAIAIARRNCAYMPKLRAA